MFAETELFMEHHDWSLRNYESLSNKYVSDISALA